MKFNIVKNKKDGNSGFGLVEVIVAIGLWSVLAVAGVVMTLGSLRLNRLGGEETNASFLAGEGIDAVRAIKKQGWATPFLGTNCVSGCGIAESVGTWVYSGSSNVINKFTRKVFVTQSQRDGSGNIVDSGGTADANTYKVRSEVTWNRGVPPITNTVSVVTYLTNFIRNIIGNWALPLQDSSMNLAGADQAVDLAVVGNYMYVLKPGAANDLIVVDVSNTASPVQVGSLSIAGAGGTRIVSDGSYAYISDSNDAGELRIVNVTNPAAPTLQSSFDATGTTNGLSVYVVGNTAYLVRVFAGGTPELVIVDVTNKSAPALLGSLQLSDDINDVVVVGNYAYLVSSDNGAELQIINVTNPSAPSLVSTFNLAGNNNGVNVVAFSDTVLVGRSGGTVAIVDTTNKAAASLIATYTGSGGNIEGMSLGNDNKYLFLGTTSGTQEVQIVDITTIGSPTLLGSVNFASNNPRCIFYDPVKDRAFVGTTDNANEIIIFKPS